MGGGTRYVNIPAVVNARELWVNGIGCDVHFFVGLEKEHFVAHRLIVAACSDYFRDVFYCGDSKCMASLNVVIPNVSPQTFSTILEFIYSTQRIDSPLITSSNFVNLFASAQYFGVKQLVKACQHFLKVMSSSDCLIILDESVYTDNKHLINQCLEYAKRRPENFLHIECLLDCSWTTLKILFEQLTFKASSQFGVFMALFSWSIAECERKQLDIIPEHESRVLRDLVNIVRFDDLSDEEREAIDRTCIFATEKPKKDVSSATERHSTLNDTDFVLPEIEAVQLIPEVEPSETALATSSFHKEDFFTTVTISHPPLIRESETTEAASSNKKLKTELEKVATFPNSAVEPTLQKPASVGSHYREVSGWLKIGDQKEPNIGWLEADIWQTQNSKRSSEPVMNSEFGNTFKEPIKPFSITHNDRQTTQIYNLVCKGVEINLPEIQTLQPLSELKHPKMALATSNFHKKDSFAIASTSELPLIGDCKVTGRGILVKKAKVELKDIAGKYNSKVQKISQNPMMAGTDNKEQTGLSKTKENKKRPNKGSLEANFCQAQNSRPLTKSIGTSEFGNTFENSVKLSTITDDGRQTQLPDSASEARKKFHTSDLETVEEEISRKIVKKTQSSLQSLNPMISECEVVSKRTNEKNCATTIEVNKKLLDVSSIVIEPYKGTAMRDNMVSTVPDSQFASKDEVSTGKGFQKGLDELPSVNLDSLDSQRRILKFDESPFVHRNSLTRAEALKFAKKIIYSTKDEEKPTAAPLPELVSKEHNFNNHFQVEISNFSTSWADGMAFCALAHRFASPNTSFDFNLLNPKNRKRNLLLAFETAKKNGVAPLLEVDDMLIMGEKPDWKCIFVYVQSFHRQFKNLT